MVDAGLSGVPVPVAELEAQSDHPVDLQEQQQQQQVQQQQQQQQMNSNTDIEVGLNLKKRKRKTTQNDQSHGSFFLRIGAIGKYNTIMTNLLFTQNIIRRNIYLTYLFSFR